LANPSNYPYFPNETEPSIMTAYRFLWALLPALLFVACQDEGTSSLDQKEDASANEYIGDPERLDIYTPVTLTTDPDQLAAHELLMIPHLIEAAKIMDTLFWLQSYGHPDTFLNQIEDEKVRQFASINYGPWDRLDNMEPFLEGVGAKPLGANFYPQDMTKEELEEAELDDKLSLYTLVERDEEGRLITVPYHEAYGPQLQRAADHLIEAAGYAQSQQLKTYLELRADALLSSNYDPSDIAWLDMEDNTLDIIIGPIENYEDRLFNAKAAFEAYVLVKDREWSERLKKYVSYLPQLQRDLPVPDAYKAEEPGRDAQLNAYDVIFYAGDCNSGSKTIAVNLPNDEEIQKSKGTRRSQLKNAMLAKFDEILKPIADELIDTAQRKHITFEAFFANTMFHEVAHGLGIKNLVNGEGTVREALQETYSALEEGKADVLGLYMVTQMFDQGVLTEGSLEDYYVTFMTSIFRSVRFGASSAHGQANMIRYNYFLEQGAFERNEETGRYRVDMDKMKTAMDQLSEIILVLQGDGVKADVEQLIADYGAVGDVLQSDLDRLSEAKIPVDIVFEQGLAQLGLEDSMAEPEE
jgi:hypothetical protein